MEIQGLRPARYFCWDRLHHLYLGIFTLTIGYYTKDKLMMAIGLFVIVDDIIEHTVTADTPLRIFYEQMLKNDMPACTCEE